MLLVCQSHKTLMSVICPAFARFACLCSAKAGKKCHLCISLIILQASYLRLPPVLDPRLSISAHNNNYCVHLFIIIINKLYEQIILSQSITFIRTAIQ